MEFEVPQWVIADNVEDTDIYDKMDSEIDMTSLLREAIGTKPTPPHEKDVCYRVRKRYRNPYQENLLQKLFNLEHNDKVRFLNAVYESTLSWVYSSFIDPCRVNNNRAPQADVSYENEMVYKILCLSDGQFRRLMRKLCESAIYAGLKAVDGVL